METLWGIDLGGTKIEGAVLDPRSPAVPLSRIRIATEQERGYEHLLSRIAELVSLLEKDSGLARPSRMGMGTPGIPDPITGKMKNSNTACLMGRSLRTDLERLLGLQLVVANDANCFALAEATLGAAKGYETVFGVIMGTGVGGGLVVQGRVLEGLHGIAGEWGHITLDPDGSPCYCGKRGCVETFLSGPALEAHYRARTGIARPLSEIAEADKAGHDPAATLTIERLCTMFGRAISFVINTFDPHAIVLGGGVGKVERLYEDGLAAARAYVFETSMRTPFLRPALGDSAGVIGAAMLAESNAPFSAEGRTRGAL